MSATTFAKVENNIVTMVCAVTYEYLVENPERYGPVELWIECCQDGTGRGYCGVNWVYDAKNDKFLPPVSETVINDE